MSALADLVAQELVGLLAPVASAQNASGPYQDVVPQGAGFPRLIFTIETDNDQLDTPRRNIDVTYSVRVISSVSYKQADTIMGAVDTALYDVDMTVTGWTNYWNLRETGTPRLADPREGGGYYYQSGAIYRARFAKEL